jgi:hypothetical protein
MLEVFENGTTTTVVGVLSTSPSIVWVRTTDDIAPVIRQADVITGKTTLEVFMTRPESVQLSYDLSPVDDSDTPDGVTVQITKTVLRPCFMKIFHG